MIFELRQFDKTLLKFEYIEESLTRAIYWKLIKKIVFFYLLDLIYLMNVYILGLNRGLFLKIENMLTNYYQKWDYLIMMFLVLLKFVKVYH